MILNAETVQSGAAVRHEDPHEVVVAVTESGQLGDTAVSVVSNGLGGEPILEWP
jgi:hypothetical protein